MPTYGRSFTLVDPAKFDIGAPASGGGIAGKYTSEAGFMAYYEVRIILFCTIIVIYKLFNCLRCVTFYTWKIPHLFGTMSNKCLSLIEKISGSVLTMKEV